MGWTIILRDGDKEILKKELNLVDDSILQSENYKVLKKLDPYGDATIHRQTLDDLIADLKTLGKQVPEISVAANTICEMAEKCKAGNQTSLKFYGD